jgi:hypothetical protein
MVINARMRFSSHSPPPAMYGPPRPARSHPAAGRGSDTRRDVEGACHPAGPTRTFEDGHWQLIEYAKRSTALARAGLARRAASGTVVRAAYGFFIRRLRSSFRRHRINPPN